MRFMLAFGNAVSNEKAGWRGVIPSGSEVLK